MQISDEKIKAALKKGKVINAPKPINYLQTARSIGNYNLSKALSDLIDNSITAHATKIFINADFNAGRPRFEIIDNGQSMSPKELYEAMEMPSSNEKEERKSKNDLGRFGWGLKSASFSQCKRLTVIAKQHGKAILARWDYDDPEMIDYEMDFREVSLDKCNGEESLFNSFTKVIWENCDKLSEDYTLSQRDFNDLVSISVDEIALTFHKIMLGESKTFKKIEIFINKKKVPPHDPFLKSNKATQALPKEKYSIKNNEKIIFKPYILPHFSKLTEKEYYLMNYNDGILKNQGFYIFRKDRLIEYGTWFKLIKLNKTSQLVRISVDIPTSVDKDWKISVDKSSAQLPAAYKKRFKELIEKISQQSSKVQYSKGNRTDKSSLNPWEKIRKHGIEKYKINTAHPCIKELEEKLSDNLLFKMVVSIIEDQLPIDEMKKDLENAREVNQNTYDKEEFINQLEYQFPIITSRQNLKKIDDIKKVFKKNAYFNKHWKLVEEFLESKFNSF